MDTSLREILENEGLTEHISIFVDQGVTDSILGELSDADLKDLGIVKLGERKRLLLRFKSTVDCCSEEVASAKPSEKINTAQRDFTYDARDGEIIITGFSGKGHVVVPSKFDELDLPVRIIDWDAFKNNGMILSIVLPEGVREIRGSAFCDCSSLTEITLPNSVKSIGASVFKGCSSLMHITIPEGITYIDSFAFANCKSLTKVDIPLSVTAIHLQAFNGCTKLTNIRVSDNVTYIGDHAFLHCGFSSITIPDTCEIGDDIAFNVKRKSTTKKQIENSFDKKLDTERDKAKNLKTRSENLGRNDACSCGSGKKFKKCCMK